MIAALSSPHVPVLVDRVAELLGVDRPGLLVDATVGAGGHAAALLEASAPEALLLGLDRDPDALALAARRLEPYGDRVRLVHDAYDLLGDHVDELVTRHGLPLLGVLYDLGLSSMQLDAPGRGFAFRVDEPLDMRMDRTSADPTAADLVNTLDEAELVDVLRTLGEERHARRIARAVVRARPLSTTAELAAVVAGAVPPAARHGRIHPATRAFQALRIAVNAELDRFRASLPQALERLQPADADPSPGAARGGRVVVLAYHSLEDRIAKRTIAEAERGCICPPDLPACACGRTPWMRWLIRGVERPGDAEVAENPRARSARLRAAERTTAEPRSNRPALRTEP